jgi:hypothetical protein
MIYFISVTGITIAIAVLGLNFDPDARFGYEAFLSPLIFGVVAVLPSFALYSRKELTLRQMLVRRIFHFVLLELILLVFGFGTGILDGTEVAISFAFSVMAVYLFTNVLQYILDSKTAGKINEGLKKLQS